jgi:hypothetical protein
LLLGTDYPFPVFEPAPLKLLEDAACSPEDIIQIGGEQARRLFKI